jgi:hypothetical protein
LGGHAQLAAGVTWLLPFSGTKSPTPQKHVRNFNGGSGYKFWRVKPVTELEEPLVVCFVIQCFPFALSSPSFYCSPEGMLLLAKLFHREFRKGEKPLPCPQPLGRDDE